MVPEPPTNSAFKADEPLIDLSDQVPKSSSPQKKEEEKVEEYEEEDTSTV